MTEAELQKLTVDGLKLELRTSFGMSVTDVNKVGNKAALQAELRSKLGLPPVAATPASGGGSSGGSSSTTASAAAASVAKQERDDLVAALVLCNHPRGTVEQFIDTQGLSKLEHLKELSPDDMEDTISRHNKVMTGANEQHRIIASRKIKKMEALVHKVRVWHLTGTVFTINDWKTDWDVEQALLELDQFRLKEKQREDPKDLKEVVKEEDLYGPNALDSIHAMETNIGQRPSAYGSGADILYQTRSLGLVPIANPTTEERFYQGLALSGTAASISDKAKIYTILEDWSQGTKLHDHVKPFRKSKDGRQAFLALKAMYLGPSSIESTLILSRKQISEGSEGVTYSGELAGSSGMPWPNYVGALNKAYMFIEEHGGDTFSQYTRVLRLIKGITGDAAQQEIIVIACEHVKNDSSLKNNFQGAASFMQTKISAVYAEALANKTRNNQSIKETNTSNTQNQYQGDGFGGGRGHYGGRGSGGRGRGGGRHGGRHGGRGGGAYDGTHPRATIDGVDVRDEVIFQSYDPSAFVGRVRSYVLNRRQLLRAQGSPYAQQYDKGRGGGGNQYEAKIQEMVVAAVAAATKRQGDGDGNPTDGKKQKDNGFKNMFNKKED